jgi:hypothetical protein
VVETRTPSSFGCPEHVVICVIEFDGHAVLGQSYDVFGRDILPPMLVTRWLVELHSGRSQGLYPSKSHQSTWVIRDFETQRHIKFRAGKINKTCWFDDWRFCQKACPGGGFCWSSWKGLLMRRWPGSAEVDGVGTANDESTPLLVPGRDASMHEEHVPFNPRNLLMQLATRLTFHTHYRAADVTGRQK